MLEERVEDISTSCTSYAHARSLGESIKLKTSVFKLLDDAGL